MPEEGALKYSDNRYYKESIKPSSKEERKETKVCEFNYHTYYLTFYIVLVQNKTLEINVQNIGGK